MVGQGGSSAGSYLADPTSPIPSHCASFVAISTLRVNIHVQAPCLHAFYVRNATKPPLTCKSLYKQYKAMCDKLSTLYISYYTHVSPFNPMRHLYTRHHNYIAIFQVMLHFDISQLLSTYCGSILSQDTGVLRLNIFVRKF